MSWKSLGRFSSMGAAALALVASQLGAQAVITNGTISLGVNREGALNVAATNAYGGVGVRYNATNWDGTFAGCTCEGWGAGISGGASNGVWGGQNTDVGGTTNIALNSFTSSASSATSVVTIGGVLQVTQAYSPSAVTANLYQVDVTLTNLTAGTLGSGASGIRYRRAMDWDIPTPGNEVVTLVGNPAANLLGTSSNGFIDSNPFSDPGTTCGAPQNANFTNVGPCDHGAVFDFGFAALGVGESKSFRIFYGAASNLANVKAALGLVGAEVASWAFCGVGRSDSINGGTCVGDAGTTFVFGFQGVGGTVVVPPPSTVPEPSTYALMATGLAAVFGMARRRRNAQA